MKALIEALRIHHDWSIRHVPGYSESGDERVAYRATVAALATERDLFAPLDCTPIEDVIEAELPPLPDGTPIMPELWSVEVKVGNDRILSIGNNWVSGAELAHPEEQTVIGAARHLLSFVGYGLPPAQFDPDAQPAEVWHAVVNGSGTEGVFFKDEADAAWTAACDDDIDSENAVGVTTLGSEFQQMYAGLGQMRRLTFKA